jgi:hypothetical protein
LPDLLRRVAALTVASALGIALLAPLAARSATPELTRADTLLDAVDRPASSLDRGDVDGRERAAALSLADAARAPLAIPETLALDADLPAPPAALMEATLIARPTGTPARPRAPTVDMETVWDRLAMCESSGNWAANTGNGYYGGLQFSHSTWHSYGGGAYSDYPHQATRQEQIAVGKRLYAVRGFQPWPACRAELGLP